MAVCCFVALTTGLPAPAAAVDSKVAPSENVEDLRDGEELKTAESIGYGYYGGGYSPLSYYPQAYYNSYPYAYHQTHPYSYRGFGGLYGGNNWW